MCITPRNIFERAYQFWLYKACGKVGRDGHVSLDEVLLKMMRSGKFFPAATWFTGRGMDWERVSGTFSPNSAQSCISVPRAETINYCH